MRLCSVALVTILALLNSAVAQTYPSYPAHVTSGAQEEALDNTSLGAADEIARELISLAFDLIKDFEKWMPTAYNDASDYCTIGYGHLVAKKDCDSLGSELYQFTQPLTEAKGVELLNKDSATARVAVQNLVKNPLTDEQFGALASFVFNVGSQKFANSTMLKYINNGEYEGAAKQFPRWIKSKGVILNGLINRRACEASLFKGELQYGPDKQFHRDDCRALGAAPVAEDIIDVTIGEQN